MPQRAFCGRMGVLPSKEKAKSPGLYASRRPFDETRCDKRTRHAYPGGCRCFLRVGEIERKSPNPMPSQQSRKTRLFGRALRDLLAQFSSREPGLPKPN